MRDGMLESLACADRLFLAARFGEEYRGLYEKGKKMLLMLMLHYFSTALSMPLSMAAGVGGQPCI